MHVVGSQRFMSTEAIIPKYINVKPTVQRITLSLIQVKHKSNFSELLFLARAMSSNLVIVVTGTNRGIGRGIVQLLANQQLDRPLTIYATSRSGANTNNNASPRNSIRYCSLDIADSSSVNAFFDLVLNEQPGIDVLINNAAVSNDDRETPDYAIQTITNNYMGTKRMCETFLSRVPHKPGARIVNVTSGHNQMHNYGPNIQQDFRNVASIADVDALMQNYMQAVQRGPDAQQAAGWGEGARSYKVSKALINALTIVLAQEHAEVILVNSCCPGWTNTDMGKQGKGTPPKTVEEGARVPVRLAIGDLGPAGDVDGGLGRGTEKVSGKFFENENIVVPGWGKAKTWLDL